MAGSAIQEAILALEGRHEVDVESLSVHIRDNFQGTLLSLRQLTPLIKEVLRRFKTLPRKAGVDGKFATIAGHRSFGVGKNDSVGWAKGVLGKDARTVRYMISGGNKRRTESKRETVSTIDARSILKKLDCDIGRLDVRQQRILASELPAVLKRLKSIRRIDAAKGKSNE
jgi:hypothetical protein